MSYVLGFDASTQSFSATLVDSSSLVVIGEITVNFGADLPQYNAPSGFIPDDSQGGTGEVHANPLMWLDALDLLMSRIVAEQWPLAEVVAICGSGQQHGSVYLNSQFEQVLGVLSPELSLAEQIKNTLSRATSPIWMDNSTRIECDEIAAAVGGDDRVCAISGSIAIERFTGPQIRKFAKMQPAAYASTQYIHLVSSFFASIFAGKSAAIDTGDGAGMNLMNLATQDWDAELVAATAEGLGAKLPVVAKPHTPIGSIANYFVSKYGFNSEAKVYAWSGDNPCSLVGMGASTAGKMIISLGTSYTLFAAMDKPLTAPNGFGHVFGNPMGGYMSLICFKNGSLAREEVRKSKQTEQEEQLDWAKFGTDYLAQTPVGNDGKLMLPFYEPEITPLMALDNPATNDWSLEDESAAVQIRACLEGQFLNMRVHSEWLGDKPSQILLTGGGSKSDEICQIAADIFGAQVVRMQIAGSASLGAAIMAGVASKQASLEQFELALCQLDHEASISPDEAAHQKYNQLMPAFNQLITNNS